MTLEWLDSNNLLVLVWLALNAFLIIVATYQVCKRLDIIIKELKLVDEVAPSKPNIIAALRKNTADVVMEDPYKEAWTGDLITEKRKGTVEG